MRSTIAHQEVIPVFMHRCLPLFIHESIDLTVEVQFKPPFSNPQKLILDPLPHFCIQNSMAFLHRSSGDAMMIMHYL